MRPAIKELIAIVWATARLLSGILEKFIEKTCCHHCWSIEEAQTAKKTPKITIQLNREIAKIRPTRLRDNKGSFGSRGGCFITPGDFGSNARGTVMVMELSIFSQRIC